MERGRVPDPTDSESYKRQYLLGLDSDVREVTGKHLIANQAKASDITLAPNTTLTFLLAANIKYRLAGRLYVTDNFKLRHAGPAAPTLFRLARHFVGSAANTHNYDVAYSAADINLSEGVLELEGIIHNGANAGFFTLQWAQQVSNVTPAQLYAGSWLQCSRIVQS